MSYINDYYKEIDTEQTGEVISGDLSRVITLYVRAYRYLSEDAKLTHVHKGDPVFIDQNLTNEESNGTVIAYDPRVNYGAQHSPTNIAGIALAEPRYPKDNSVMSYPFPIAVAGEVIANVFAGIIRQRAGTDTEGRYYTGEYIAADGTPSASPDWEAGSKLLLGQIIAPKTTTEDGVAPIYSRLYPRYPGGEADYYHMPIRLMCGSVIPAAGGGQDDRAAITATNASGGNVAANTKVAVTRNYNDGTWDWTFIVPLPGAFTNGVTIDAIDDGDDGRVLVAGQVVYLRDEVYNIIASSPRAKLTPFGARVMAKHASNDDILDGYYVGMRVNGELTPIETGVPGNLFGQIVDIDNNAGTITVTLDPVATHAPANVADVTIDSAAINEDTPAGTALIENPITHVLTPCRFDTDNVDGILMPATPLPTINGWNLQDYRAIYGSTVFMAPDGTFWSGVKAFAKGVYKRVLKPVAKWAISIALPVASSYVSPLGNVLASHVATKCGQLLAAVGGPIPPNNTVTSVFGKNIRNEELIEVYTDNGGGYANSHPNATYVYDIDAPTENVSWAIGDCLTINETTGKAQKVTSYDTPITAVVNFAPAQDPETNGWKIAGIASGFRELRSSTLKVGKPVLYDGTDATSRLAQKLATAIIGYVKEVWQPSPQTLAAVKEGKLPADEELPNCIVEVAPEFVPAGTSDEPLIRQYKYTE